MAALVLGLSVLAFGQGSQESQFTRPPAQPDGGRLAGLQWTFVRIRYSANSPSSHYRIEYWGEPWAIDGPAAEQNLSRRLRTVTAIEVADPIVMTLEDPRLWQYPWIYIVEPGNLRLKDAEVPILREFLLRGGTRPSTTSTGRIEWENLERRAEARVPRSGDRRPAADRTRSIRCFYKLDEYPQTPGLGSFLQGRTWEKGGFVAHLRAIEDDRRRPMVLINWNTDMGDGWEWSNAEDYPGYVKFTAQAYRMEINEIVYSLTH